MFASVMYPNDVGMTKSCGQVGLTNEPLPKRKVAGYVRAKDLERLLPRQTWMLDQVYLAHSSRSEQAQNPVPGKGFTDPQRHGRMLVGDMAVLRRFPSAGA